MSDWGFFFGYCIGRYSDVIEGDDFNIGSWPGVIQAEGATIKQIK